MTPGAPSEGLSAPPAHIIVIGGGFAGLSAATALAEHGVRVTVLEGRQVLGGRAYSFADTQMGDPVDNGQHLFMGCYDETQIFLERIGALDRLVFQSNLSVEFLGDSERGKLSCWPLPAPFHLLSGLLTLGTLSWGDRFRLRHFQRALKAAAKNPQAVERLTVDEWLAQAHQSEGIRRNFWDLIAIATLNEDPKIASAAPFVTVLAKAFFGKQKASRLGVSAVGLSDLYTTSARQFIEARGGDIRTKAPVAQVKVGDDRVSGVELRDGSVLSADGVISAVSAPSFLKMMPAALIDQEPVFQNIKRLKHAPIISIHLWFDREISKSAFVGLLNTHVQWFFNKSKIFGNKDRPGYVSLVISGAHAFIDWEDKRITTMAVAELHRLFPVSRDASVVRSLVIKEHAATLSPTVGSEALRPPHRTPFKNFLIAGDWTRTGLPATIESACLSGHTCAVLVMNSQKEFITRAGSTEALHV